MPFEELFRFCQKWGFWAIIMGPDMLESPSKLYKRGL